MGLLSFVALGVTLHDEFEVQRQDLAKYSFIRNLNINPSDWRFSIQKVPLKGYEKISTVQALAGTQGTMVAWTGPTRRLTFFIDHSKQSGGKGKLKEEVLFQAAQVTTHELGFDGLQVHEKDFRQFGDYHVFLCEKVDGIDSTLGRSIHIGLNSSNAKVNQVSASLAVDYIRGAKMLSQTSAKAFLDKYLKVHTHNGPATFVGLRWIREDKVYPDQIPRMHKVYMFNTKPNHGFTSYMVDAYTDQIADQGW